MNKVQWIGRWCSRVVSELCDISCKKAKVWEGWSEESSSIYVLLKEYWGLIPLGTMAVARNRKHYLPSLRTGAALEKAVRLE